MRDESGSNHRCRTGRSGGRSVAWRAQVVAGALCLLVHGCDTSTGGAVELSWKLRPASSSLADKFVDCEPGQDEMTVGGTSRGTVQWIRLNWQVTDNSQLIASDHSEWRCDYSHGVTRFELPAGTAELSVVPECASNQPADPDTYIAPAPVQRVVIRGDTVSLGAVELVVSVSSCDPRPVDPQPGAPAVHPCICVPPGLR
jgi:hypothetical protein